MHEVSMPRWVRFFILITLVHRARSGTATDARSSWPRELAAPTHCAPGEVLRPGGACEPCPPGMSSGGGNSTHCTVCPRGTFNPEWGGICMRCPFNTFSLRPNSTECGHCPASQWQGVVAPRGRFICREIAPDIFALLMLIVYIAYILRAAHRFIRCNDLSRAQFFVISLAPRMLINVYSTGSFLATAYPTSVEKIGFALLFPNPAFFFLVSSLYWAAGLSRPTDSRSLLQSSPGRRTTGWRESGHCSWCCATLLGMLLAPVRLLFQAVVFTTFTMAFDWEVEVWQGPQWRVPDFAFLGHALRARRAKDMNLLTWNMIKLATTLLNVLPNLALAFYVVVVSASNDEDLTEWFLQAMRVIFSSLSLCKLVVEWIFRMYHHDMHPLHMDPTLTWRETWSFSSDAAKGVAAVVPSRADAAAHAGSGQDSPTKLLDAVVTPTHPTTVGPEPADAERTRKGDRGAASAGPVAAWTSTRHRASSAGTNQLPRQDFTSVGFVTTYDERV